MRYLLQHPNETRPSLIVDVVEVAGPDVLSRVRESMVSRGCAHALVIDAQTTHVLRDTFSSTGPDSIVEEAALDSARLFGGAGALAPRVLRWLEAMSANWSATLPREDWVAPLFYDIVPATSGSNIQRIESDAA